jgi:hypothetical protein
LNIKVGGSQSIREPIKKKFVWKTIAVAKRISLLRNSEDDVDRFSAFMNKPGFGLACLPCIYGKGKQA